MTGCIQFYDEEKYLPVLDKFDPDNYVQLSGYVMS